jgi:hypothetical protein
MPEVVHDVRVLVNVNDPIMSVLHGCSVPVVCLRPVTASA